MRKRQEHLSEQDIIKRKEAQREFKQAAGMCVCGGEGGVPLSLSSLYVVCLLPSLVCGGVPLSLSSL